MYQVGLHDAWQGFLTNYVGPLAFTVYEGYVQVCPPKKLTLNNTTWPHFQFRTDCCQKFNPLI